MVKYSKLLLSINFLEQIVIYDNIKQMIFSFFWEEKDHVVYIKNLRIQKQGNVKHLEEQILFKVTNVKKILTLLTNISQADDPNINISQEIHEAHIICNIYEDPV